MRKQADSSLDVFVTFVRVDQTAEQAPHGQVLLVCVMFSKLHTAGEQAFNTVILGQV
jgi:hypothetical protein